MELFKRTKKQPIKIRNFKYIGNAQHYPNIVYYYKELLRDNFEIMTCALEGTLKKPEIGAGTNVKVIDVFMANYLYNLRNDIKTVDIASFVESTIKHSFADLKEEEQKGMIKKFNSAIPTEIKSSSCYKEAKKDGFNVLYCSNDESEDRKFGVVNVVMYKDIKIDSKDERFDIHSSYTIFRPLNFRTSPSYIKGDSKIKYIEFKQEDINIDHDLLI
jgi:hypothetical protein